MRRIGTLLAIALAASASACIVERGEVRPDPQVAAPPPPPADTAPESSYQASAPPPAPGGDVADETVFYQDLSPYGSWTYVAPYGRVWVPAVGYGWRPYYYGRWVLTDWGWTFVSDDPWGWAAYHYGRWNWAVGYGWYWIPGRVWGPAWVSWRWGGGYAAWCPLGPEGVYFGYSHPAWIAVREQHFTRPIRSVAVPVHATSGIVRTAQPLAGAQAVPTARGGSFGPPVAGIQRAIGQPIARVSAAQVVPRPHASAPPTGRGEAGTMRSPVRQSPRTLGSGGDSRPYGPGAVRAAPRPYGGAGHGAPARPYGGGAVQGPPHNGGGGGSGSHPHAGSKSK